MITFSSTAQLIKKVNISPQNFNYGGTKTDIVAQKLILTNTLDPLPQSLHMICPSPPTHTKKNFFA